MKRAPDGVEAFQGIPPPERMHHLQRPGFGARLPEPGSRGFVCGVLKSRKIVSITYLC
jgi:hypothetical protein